MSSHTVRSVRIRSFSGPYFPAFGLTERYVVSLRIQFECGKIRTGKISETDTFHAVHGNIDKYFPRFLYFAILLA